jgi:hypothetical protein
MQMRSSGWWRVGSPVRRSTRNSAGHAPNWKGIYARSTARSPGCSSRCSGGLDSKSTRRHTVTRGSMRVTHASASGNVPGAASCLEHRRPATTWPRDIDSRRAPCLPNEGFDARGTFGSTPSGALRAGQHRYVVSGQRLYPSFSGGAADASFIPGLVDVAHSFAWTQGVLTSAGRLDWPTALPLEARLDMPDGTRLLATHLAPGHQDGQASIQLCPMRS